MSLSRLDKSIAVLPAGWSASSVGRRTACEQDPILFAFVYLNHHLRGAGGGDQVSLSDVHYDWAEHAKRWMSEPGGPAEDRHAFVAPRNMGKTTWWFLILPLWAAAYGHIKFAAAFADSTSQAEGHLLSFKMELERNELLQSDFPELCAPLTRGRGSHVVADNRGMYQSKSGFVFAAKGIDSSNLGMKVGNLRPDLLILDDVEPDEANYSGPLANQRLGTISDAVLPLNVYARVVWCGTVTMDGSLIHQLVKTQTSAETPPAWITDENWGVSYHRAIETTDDGSERSCWPEKWSLAFLQSIRHTRSYMKNYDNQPMSEDAAYWGPDDFTYESLPVYPRTLLSVDPAVTTKKSSDFTGLAVVSHSKTRGKVYVRDCWQVRLTGKALRHKVSEVLRAYPEIQVILVEINQGGQLWEDVFKDLGVKVVTKHQSIRKETRAGFLLNGYQARTVVHTKPLPDLQRQMMAFPNALNDDMVDAVGTAYLWLEKPHEKEKKATPFRARTRSYV